MNQDMFNKIVTASLLVFFMVMFAISYILNRPLNLESFLTLIGPILVHGMHLIDKSVSNNVAVKAASQNVTPENVAAIKQVVSNTSPVIN